MHKETEGGRGAPGLKVLFSFKVFSNSICKKNPKTMSQSEHIPIPNHTIDPKTGFLESNAYASAFDAERKTAFLRLYKLNGIRIRRASREMGLSEDTVSRHLRLDPVFKKAFDDVEKDYLEELEATSRTNALNPRSVIERIFQLKCLIPEKYGQENRPMSTAITINFDSAAHFSKENKLNIVEGELIPPLITGEHRAS